jgi:NAD+ synthetase
MHPELQEALIAYRNRRKFDPQIYLDTKSALLNLYFTQSGIKACVVGISGGIDSAVTAAILVNASRIPGSPLKRIVPLLLPMHTEGATHQDTATSRGSEVCDALEIPPVEIDLSSTMHAAREASLAGSGIKGSSWASGQLVSYLRTPILYYHSALVSEGGLPCVVCGTTNRDEGSYIGFFGKASDGMVDIQPISDLHKSEVYKLAALLGLPESVVTAIPTGDTYDGLCDKEMIGTSYDFLELYEWWLCEEKRDLWLNTLSENACREFKNLGEKLEVLHRKNKHKYLGDSPAVHLDLFTRAVPGGWRRQDGLENPVFSRETALKARVGPVDLPADIARNLDSGTSSSPHTVSVLDFGDSAVLVSQALSQEICSEIVSESKMWTWIKADQHGHPIHENQKASSAVIGSYRATAFDEAFADRLWKRLSLYLPEFRKISELTPTDHNGYPAWKPIGINPMLRFIRYEEGGYIVPHYDAGFDFKDNRRHTLMSVIVSLTESENSGTRFLLDKQRNIPLDERSFDDWDDIARDKDILFSVPLSKGDALIFDHRIIHDAPIWHGTSSRIILRTDVVFERCASHAIPWTNFSCQTSVCDPEPGEKWANDPTYRKAHLVLGEEINKAGYFDDDLAEFVPFLPEVRTAPLRNLFSNLSSTHLSATLTVLVTTGSMCPLHKGHINMMHEARKAVEKSGRVVLTGFIVPDHDSYVSEKCGSDALNIAQRIYLAEQAIGGSDWLVIDHWAGFYTPADVNFTTIIDRIAAQLAVQVPIARPIELVYVCGGDLAWFGLSFIRRGECVVVSRPGYTSTVEEVKRHSAIENNPRITFVNGSTNAAASSNIRKGDIEELPQNISEKYLKIREGQGMTVQQDFRWEETMEEVNFYIRYEGDWAVSHWAESFGVGIENYSHAYDIFYYGLVKAFEDAFENARQTAGGPKVHIIPLRLSDQQKTFQELVKINHSNDLIISLDPCLPSTHNIAISRCFEPVSVGDDCEFVARPGSDPLEKQLEQIVLAIKSREVNQKVVLFDDDSYTGKTAAAVKSLIQAKDPSCTVDEFITLCTSDGPLDLKPNERRPRLNLIDCRDFLAGSREGGLVIRVPQAGVSNVARQVCRVPYVLPFVRPAYRASIPIDQELAFSQRVRELNMNFMDDVGLSKNDIQGGFCTSLHDWIGLEDLFS